MFVTFGQKGPRAKSQIFCLTIFEAGWLTSLISLAQTNLWSQKHNQRDHFGNSPDKMINLPNNPVLFAKLCCIISKKIFNTYPGFEPKKLRVLFNSSLLSCQCFISPMQMFLSVFSPPAGSLPLLSSEPTWLNILMSWNLSELDVRSSASPEGGLSGVKERGV